MNFHWIKVEIEGATFSIKWGNTHRGMMGNVVLCPLSISTSSVSYLVGRLSIWCGWWTLVSGMTTEAPVCHRNHLQHNPDRKRTSNSIVEQNLLGRPIIHSQEQYLDVLIISPLKFPGQKASPWGQYKTIQNTYSILSVFLPWCWAQAVVGRVWGTSPRSSTLFVAEFFLHRCCLKGGRFFHYKKA